MYRLSETVDPALFSSQQIADVKGGLVEKASSEGAYINRGAITLITPDDASYAKSRGIELLPNALVRLSFTELETQLSSQINNGLVRKIGSTIFVGQGPNFNGVNITGARGITRLTRSKADGSSESFATPFVMLAPAVGEEQKAFVLANSYDRIRTEEKPHNIVINPVQHNLLDAGLSQSGNGSGQNCRTDQGQVDFGDVSHIANAQVSLDASRVHNNVHEQTATRTTPDMVLREVGLFSEQTGNTPRPTGGVTIPVSSLSTLIFTEANQIAPGERDISVFDAGAVIVGAAVETRQLSDDAPRVDLATNLAEINRGH